MVDVVLFLVLFLLFVQQVVLLSCAFFILLHCSGSVTFASFSDRKCELFFIFFLSFPFQSVLLFLEIIQYTIQMLTRDLKEKLKYLWNY